MPAPLSTTTSDGESEANLAARDSVQLDLGDFCAGQPGELAGMGRDDDRMCEPREHVGLANERVQTIGVDHHWFGRGFDEKLDELPDLVGLA